MTTSPTTSINEELLAELEQLAGKATPGPWEWEDREVDEEGYGYIPECSYLVGAICLAGHHEGYEDDCDFIAAANPATILALLQHVRELSKDRERLDAIEANCWDVRYNSSPNGDAGDSSIGIEIVGHWMDKPCERVVGENYSENLRAALDQAMKADAYPPARPEYD